MKDNTRNFIAVFGLAFMLFMTFGFIFKYCTSIKTLDIRDTESNIKKLDVYKTEINKVTNEKCKNALNDFVKHYENTSYEDNGKGDNAITVSKLKKDFIIVDEDLDTIRVTAEKYMNLRTACGSKDTVEEKEYNDEITQSMLAIFVLEDELVQSLGTSQFVIGSNFYVYDYSYASMAPSIYYLHRFNYLNIIDNVIKLEKLRGEYNE
jgi:hypothetical protein